MKKKTVKDTKNLCRQEKETEEIKDRLLEDLKNLSEQEHEEAGNCHPVRVSSFWSNSYIE